jgi:hypothetical protein
MKGKNTTQIYAEKKTLIREDDSEIGSREVAFDDGCDMTQPCSVVE